MRESLYVRGLNELARGSPVVILVRTSGASSPRRRQLYFPRVAIELAGLVEVGFLAFRCSGHGENWRRAIRSIADLAKREKASILVTEVNRAIRSRNVSNDWDAVPGPEEIAEFLRLKRGAIVASVLPPDTPAAIVRRIITAQGEFISNWDKAKRNRSPGYKRRLREILKPEAIRLRRLGLSYGQIKRLLNLRERSTASEWTRDVVPLASEAVRNFAVADWEGEPNFHDEPTDFTSVRIIPRYELDGQ